MPNAASLRRGGKKRRRSAYTASGDVMRRWVCALLAGGGAAVRLRGRGDLDGGGDEGYRRSKIRGTDLFDDGPSPRCTPRLLDGLREMGGKGYVFRGGLSGGEGPGHRAAHRSGGPSGGEPLLRPRGPAQPDSGAGTGGFWRKKRRAAAGCWGRGGTGWPPTD